MIDLYRAAWDVDAGFSNILQRARVALGKEDFLDAIRLLVGGLRQVHNTRADEYQRGAVLLREAYVRAGATREALTLDWFVGDHEGAVRRSVGIPLVDRGRSLLALADADPANAVRLCHEAGKHFEDASLLVRAAVAYERAKEWDEARALWSRLAQSMMATATEQASGADLYAAGLAHFNLFRTSKKVKDQRGARTAANAAVQLLEEAADRHERGGERERAFDCYQVLLSIGRQSKTFEHVLGGYVNVLRILGEDHLRHYALQTYEEAVKAAEDGGELSAAATLAREMAQYARKAGEPAAANHATLLEAALWQRASKDLEHRHMPASMIENACLASVLALGEAGQFKRVGEMFAALAALPIESRRKEHYRKASARYASARDERLDASPLAAHLRNDAGYPDVWHVDLLEWEERGLASEATADVLLDATSYSELTRRRALVARLVALAFEANATSEGAILLCESLSTLELYGMLSPLETLGHWPDKDVRAAAQRTLSKFLYKRTFVAVRAGLADEEHEVVRAATAALEQLRFPHAFDPLARVYRETTSPAVRHAALRALARIELVEAAELLLSVLSYGTPQDKNVVADALKAAHGRAFLDVAQRAAMDPKHPAMAQLRDILGTGGFS